MDRDSEYKPNDSAIAPEERAYGALSESANRNVASEDREATQSELSGRVSKREVEELRADAGDANLNATGTRYKGRGNDAMRQERDLDNALEQEGAI